MQRRTVMADNKRICDNCGRFIAEPAQMYTIRIQLYARPDPLEFSDEDIAAASEGKLAELIEQLEEMDPDEAMDQVYEVYSFDLCGACRRVIHQQLKSRTKPAEN